MGVLRSLRKVRAAALRTAISEGAGVSQTGLRVDSAPSLSCAETTGPRLNRFGSLLTSEQCIQNTGGGLISLCSSHYYRPMSKGLRNAGTGSCAIKCLLVCIYYCIHMALTSLKRLTPDKHFRAWTTKTFTAYK